MAQVGAKTAARYANDPENGGSFIKGHRMWLRKYIDDNIKLDGFYCPKIEFTAKQESGGLERVIEKIKGDATQ